jgi:ATP-dependent DNA helicase RecG
MRPEILFPLFAPLTSLQGVGPKLAGLIARVCGPRIADLLWVFPHSIRVWAKTAQIANTPDDETELFKLRIVEHIAPKNPRLPYKIRASDGTSFLDLVFFKVKGDYLHRSFPVGEIRYVGGKLERFNDRPQIAHPDRVFTEAEFARGPVIDVIYPLTEGLTPRVMAKAAQHAADGVPNLPEWQDPAWRAAQKYPGWLEAVQAVHHPVNDAELEPLTPPKLRLAYDELLANQLALSLVRNSQRGKSGRAFSQGSGLRALALKALPFTLTSTQSSALSELDQDIGSGQRMLRLLQGDVGSGKTAIAFLLATAAIANGAQAALMAPTEVLARQHLATIGGWAEKCGVRVSLLTGREQGKARNAILNALALGEIDILIGTHALLTETVAFRDLGLAIVDEQHRFGVAQRLALSSKAGTPPHVLVMTATPIPRSLALAHYGDLDVTRITGKPPGRKDIDTKAMPLNRVDDVLEAIERALLRRERAFWICPLVEESEKTDAMAAEERFQSLSERWGGQVGLLHGRMKGPEKDQTIQAFATGKTAILVATTVVEVGVDVPAATIMVVEHAERFGLAQLHQLRGRVGRSDKASHCILLYQQPLSDAARARLNCLRETNDGFLIAEEDLRLRGAGELLGEKQSGLPDFKIARLDLHGDLLKVAHDDARLVLARDPELQTPRGQALRVLLYLFERDDAVRTLRAG